MLGVAIWVAMETQYLLDAESAKLAIQALNTLRI